MKKLLLIFLAFVLFTACESDANKMVRVFENGIEKAQKAQTRRELSNINIEVNNELMSIAQNSPTKNEKMSKEETRKVLDAQNRFDTTVENIGRGLPY